jgi:hypothetical protein
MATCLHEDQELDDSLSFFQCLMSSPHWNVIYFIRSVLLRVIDFLIPVVREKLLLNLIPIILHFLFFSSSLEKYGSNLELDTKFSLPKTGILIRTIQRLSLPDYCHIFAHFSDGNPRISLSVRVKADGTWIDLGLVLAFIRLISAAHFQPDLVFPFLETRFRLSDIVCFIFGNVIRSKNASPDHLLLFDFPFVEKSSFAIFLLYFHRISHLLPVDVTSAFLSRHADFRTDLTNTLDPLTFSSEFGNLLARAIAIFCADFSAKDESLLLSTKDRMGNLILKLIDYFQYLNAIELDPRFRDIYQQSQQSYELSLQSTSALSEKSYKRIFRELSTNHSP